MREIKFRGFNKKNKQWLYGFYLQNRGAHFVCPDEFAHGKTWDDYEVDPNTIGQFTGLMDMYDNEIVEGDVVCLDGQAERRVVVFYEGAFNIATLSEWELLNKGEHPYINDYAHMTRLDEWSCTGSLRTIGNIHDNQEVLARESKN